MVQSLADWTSDGLSEIVSWIVLERLAGWHIMTTQTFDKKKKYGNEFGLQRDLLDTRVYNYNYL